MIYNLKTAISAWPGEMGLIVQSSGSVVQA